MKIIVSFSGGRTSAYMAYLMQTRPEFQNVEKHYVFSNTGKEREETLIFVEKCCREFGLNVTWVEAQINQEMGIGCDWRRVDFATASRNGQPFSDMVRKFGIPNKDFPHCTRELKERPMKKWAAEIVGGEYVWAIGFRADEKRRAGNTKGKIFPLIHTWPTSERIVRDFWAKMPFDLRLKDYEGNCDLCWKKSLSKRLTIISENPEIGRQWAEWEAGGEYVFDRDGLSIFQLLEISGREKFKRAKDKYATARKMPELFGVDLLRESSCHCT